MARGLLIATVALLLGGCSGKSPTEPNTVLGLTVESVSTYITAGDYRNYFVRIRVRDTAGTPSWISRIALEFTGDNVAASRTFTNIPTGAIPANQSVELDDLVVQDERHELDRVMTIVATVTYATSTGRTATAAGAAAIPACMNRFRVTGPEAMNVGQSGQMSGSLTFGCQPNFLPLSPSQIEWQSLSPDIAGVDRAGIVAARASGAATIRGIYGVPVATHTVRVAP